jgi:hypothetical protein
MNAQTRSEFRFLRAEDGQYPLFLSASSGTGTTLKLTLLTPLWTNEGILNELDPMMASQTALALTWQNEDEDEAWKDL